MKRARSVIALFLVLVAAGVALAGGSQNCVTVPLGDNDNTTSAVYQVRPFNSPWTAWLGTEHGTAATVTVTGFGPCLDTRPAATCDRGAGMLLDTLSASKLATAGPGPIDAVQFSATTACGTPTCAGGANENGACSANSACPGSTCGPCRAYPSFCGVTTGGRD